MDEIITQIRKILKELNVLDTMIPPDAMYYGESDGVNITELLGECHSKLTKYLLHPYEDYEIEFPMYTDGEDI